ncbi:MAG: hypothetical protein CSA22_02540 [Deltaproteobacteria bacterium]|nr:MAG: hypothetical protein CSA22_02540 [Deltaproteobacteria bacterium]
MNWIYFAIVFVLIWVVVYLLVKERTGLFSQKLDQETEKITAMLDALFMVARPSLIRKAVVCCCLVGVFTGIVMPGLIADIDVKATVSKAISLNQSGDHEAVLALLDGSEKRVSPLLQNELGVAYAGTGNYGLAEQAFKNALDTVPEYVPARVNLAGVYMKLGRLETAGFELARAREYDEIPLSETAVIGKPRQEDRWIISAVLALILGVIGYRIPGWGLAWLKNRRLSRFEDQLADGLVMVSNGLKAGLNLTQAFENVSREGDPPLAQEFSLVLKETRLGYDLDDALIRLSARMPTDDTKLLVNSILILRESGGNLASIFDTLVHTINERKRVLKKIKTMTAEGETQAYMLAVLPLALGFLLSRLTPDVFALMYTTFFGWCLIALMVLMEGIGLIWMLKTVKVKI